MKNPIVISTNSNIKICVERTTEGNLIMGIYYINHPLIFRYVILVNNKFYHHNIKVIHIFLNNR